MHWTPGDPLELHVSGFTLRSLRVADVSRRYLHWLKDPAVSRYQNSRFENTCLSDLRDFVAGHDNDSSFLLGIFDQSD